MISQQDVTDGRVRVRVGARVGRFVKFIPANGSPTGGVIVLFEGNVQSAYENDDDITVLDGKLLLATVTEWQKAGPDDWICFFVGQNKTAGRTDTIGWIAYGAEGGFTNGRCEGVIDGREKVANALRSMNIDVTALDRFEIEGDEYESES